MLIEEPFLVPEKHLDKRLRIASHAFVSSVRSAGRKTGPSCGTMIQAGSQGVVSLAMPERENCIAIVLKCEALDRK
jgi:hypothetical protein